MGAPPPRSRVCSATNPAATEQPSGMHSSLSSSGQSSSGGSGHSSPQREEEIDVLVPPAPLPGQPSSDELDLWESLMSLDGAGARPRTAHAPRGLPRSN